MFDRTDLLAGDRIAGPALIREANATTVVEPGWTAEITQLDHMMLRRMERLATRVAAGSERPDPVLLELFNNLFMNVAEQTGAVLQNTSMSVNIKERLDFSCAIFDAEGFLVANAPHVPVHLGAMGESVRTVLNNRRNTLKPGDVVALNNPFNGGTHLPDVTVITPVFDETRRDDHVLRRQPRPSCRYRRHHAWLHAARIAHPGRGRRGDRRFPAGRWRTVPRGGTARAAGRWRNIRRAALM